MQRAKQHTALAYCDSSPCTRAAELCFLSEFYFFIGRTGWFCFCFFVTKGSCFLYVKAFGGLVVLLKSLGRYVYPWRQCVWNSAPCCALPLYHERPHKTWTVLGLPEVKPRCPFINIASKLFCIYLTLNFFLSLPFNLETFQVERFHV